MSVTTEKREFPGASGARLAARFDRPEGKVRAVALFAHCFTCSKDIFAARQIADELARRGIAVLRFDFTGLGHSEGEFASTGFSSNVADLRAAAEYLRREGMAPSLLIGHSLGGAAVLAAAPDLAEVKAVVTIGAPADAAHVVRHFGPALSRIREQGTAEVTLGGRAFTIRDTFLDDLEAQAVTQRLGHMNKALMILHAPLDDVVGIDNATAIYRAARHPKSFVSLDTADHLLTRKPDARYAAEIIAAWASRYVGEAMAEDQFDAPAAEDAVTVTETREGRFQAAVATRHHAFLADEPREVGGLDSGLSPYELLSAALGACTTMTLRIYADRKGLAPGRFSVEVTHGKVHAADCEDCSEEAKAMGGRIDRFERKIRVEGGAGELADKLVEIADKCPVHKTLSHGAAVVTKIEPS